MNKVLAGVVLVAAAGFLGSASPVAQAPQAGSPKADRAAMEKTLVANERAVGDAFVKGNKAKVQELLADEGWSIDPMGGPMATAEVMKMFEQMSKDMKITSWDISDTRTLWVDDNTAVLMYKWTGEGTYQGQPIPSPTWASTVWHRRGGRWQAVFHQESMPPKQ